MGEKQSQPEQDIAHAYGAKDRRGQPVGLTLERLALDHGENVYHAAAGQGLLGWGPTWAVHRRYPTLGQVQRELKLEQGSELADPGFADLQTRDFRVPPNSPAIRMKAYPQCARCKIGDRQRQRMKTRGVAASRKRAIHRLRDRQCPQLQTSELEGKERPSTVFHVQLPSWR